MIGFPLGSMSTRGKVAECKYAIEDGASEIDMVLNVGLLKSKDVEGVFKDVEAVAQVCKANNVILKVILEVCLLTPSEIKESSEISLKAGADFIKTSTGIRFEEIISSFHKIYTFRTAIKDFPRMEQQKLVLR